MTSQVYTVQPGQTTQIPPPQGLGAGKQYYRKWDGTWRRWEVRWVRFAHEPDDAEPTLAGIVVEVLTPRRPNNRKFPFIEY